MSKSESKSTATQKLIRQPTWPALTLLTPSMSKNKNMSPDLELDGDIDEDPFSHFLSPVLDDEDPLDDDDFDAGITTFDDEVEYKRTNFRTRLGERWESLMSRPKRPRTPPDEDQLPDLETDDPDTTKSPLGSPSDLKMLEDELDGWEADRARQSRITFGFPLQRPRFKTSRTLSGRKHSYIEPSADLWTVEEDDENEAVKPIRRGRGTIRSKRW